MLTQLTICNFGLIDQLDIEFSQNLNILTGATGAGKSIIIDGLRFVLGDKLKQSLIRDAQKSCIVEAVFELNKKFLGQNDMFRDFIEGSETNLIINRQILPDGKNKIKINGFNVTVSQLKEIGNRLIDFHGAHDHQMLLSEDSHLKILDQLTEFLDKKQDYFQFYKSYIDLKNKLSELQNLSRSRSRDLDLLTHQIKELEQLPLSNEKYDSVCQSVLKINNIEKLHESCSSILELLELENIGLVDHTAKCFSFLKTLNQIDEKTAVFQEYLNNVQENLNQLSMGIKNYLESLSFDPSQAQEINRQYDIYEDIKRKYGPSLEEANAFFEQAKEKFNLLNNFDDNENDLKNKISLAEQELKVKAGQLSVLRKKTALRLKNTIEQELKDLGIKHVNFEVRISKADFNETGSDHVIFFISPNLGEELKPLAEIISSGEAARVMLALKKALIKVDPIPVLIFDEIDAQIGGRLGTITGQKLKELAHDRQVILITHLPQIASFADRHFKVDKKVINGRTVVAVSALQENERIQELAQMLSGEKKTDISLTHARDMLKQATKV